MCYITISVTRWKTNITKIFGIGPSASIFLCGLAICFIGFLIATFFIYFWTEYLWFYRWPRNACWRPGHWSLGGTWLQVIVYFCLSINIIILTFTQVVTNYPKRALLNGAISLAAVDLKGRAVLFVQELVWLENVYFFVLFFHTLIFCLQMCGIWAMRSPHKIYL